MWCQSRIRPGSRCFCYCWCLQTRMLFRLADIYIQPCVVRLIWMDAFKNLLMFMCQRVMKSDGPRKLLTCTCLKITVHHVEWHLLIITHQYRWDEASAWDPEQQSVWNISSIEVEEILYIFDLNLLLKRCLKSKNHADPDAKWIITGKRHLSSRWGAMIWWHVL